jgi:HD-GYP domain-containing protein (c-di-GMP phosphodiesterase class II)
MAAAIDTDVPLVQLDHLGTPAALSGSLTLRCLGVPASARQRLEASGATLVDEDTDETALDALVVSTRLAPQELGEVSDRLAARVGRTIVLAHTGAERLAADLVRAGADAVVGEGNEEALIGLVDSDRTPVALLASFERRFGARSGREGTGLDPATGLPDRRAFEGRIGTLADADETPRIGYLRVQSDRWSTSSPDPVVTVQRRRLATSLAHVAGAMGVELFTTGANEFGLVGPTVSPHDADRLGSRLVEATAAFRDRGLPLRLVVGHAGPESAQDTEELLSLARRAVDVAAVDGVRQVLGAEDLALGVSVTTELEAVVRLLDEVEAAMPEGRGHGERVGRTAAELARLRGFSPAAVARTQLAAHLHEVGRAGLPPQAIAGPGELEGELLEAWRTFPVRSAELLQLTAGPQVAATVRAQRERWDGDGFPDGVRGGEIPEAARVLAVAHAIEELLLTERTLTPSALATRLRARAGTELDPELVDIAAENAALLAAVRG